MCNCKCVGAVSSKGSKGNPGTNGTDGTDGTNGTDGANAFKFVKQVVLIGGEAEYISYREITAGAAMPIGIMGAGTTSMPIFDFVVQIKKIYLGGGLPVTIVDPADVGFEQDDVSGEIRLYVAIAEVGVAYRVIIVG